MSKRDRRKILNLHTVIGRRGGVSVVHRELLVSSATIYRWLKDGSLPADRAPWIGDAWGLPALMIHDPWAGTVYAAEVMTPEKTRAYLDRRGVK